jgi:L-ascorbate metabolism protein UlaG (beta-lactamase superfamily)
MKLTYLGHSGFSLELEGAQVLIDPFITGNPLAVHQPESFSPSHIILTHAHGDHVGDTETIARRSNAEIISSFEIINYFAAKDLNGHGMNPGGGFDFPFGRVTFTPAWHSSSFPDGTYGGMPMGVVIQAAGKQLYHAGDTALFSDMALIGRKGLDAALLPIGDNFTMGPEDALEAIKLLKPKVVIPIHYNTFELIEQDTDAFKAAVERQTEAKCVILKAGEDYELS